MTAIANGDGRGCNAPADGSTAAHEDMDQSEAPASTAPTVTRVPLHGPVDTYDVMCAKVIFALCGSVFPHPLLLAQQLLGIEDQDFPEFQLNVAEAGNNCIDIVAAYLTNLRVMQQEEDPNPPVSPAMIQPRHAVTVATVAAKARELMCELALARSTVKPRKAPKNKAIESAARAAAAAAAVAAPGNTTSTPPSTSASPGASGSSAFTASSGSAAESGTSSSSEVVPGLSETPSDMAIAFGEDALCSESTDDSGSTSCCGHQDTSRQGDSCVPRSAREEEERLLYALQGPVAAEETLKMARAKPAGCKGTSGATPLEGRAVGNVSANGPTSSAANTQQQHNHHNGHAISTPSHQNGHSSSHAASTNAQSHTASCATTAAASANAASASAAVSSGSPRAGPPPPPPTRTSSSVPQYGAVQGSSTTSGNVNGHSNGQGISGQPTGQRHSQDMGRSSGAVRGGGGGGVMIQSGPSLQTALSCPVTGLPEMLPGQSCSPPASASNAHVGSGGGGGSGSGGSHQQQHHNTQSHSHRRNSGQQQTANGNGGAGGGSGRRNNLGGCGGGGGSRASPSTSPVVLQQQLQGQQQQLAVAHLLGLRTSYGNSAYGNLFALQGAAYAANAAAAAAAGSLSHFGTGGAPSRLDLNPLNSMAATTAALELAAAQQVALSAATNGMHQLNQHMGFGAAAAAAGFGSQAGSAAMQAAGLGQLAGQLGSASGLSGLTPAAALMQQQHHQQQHHHHQQQQAAVAAAAAALLQGSGGMLLADSIKAAGAGTAADWSNVLLQAQLAAGTLS